MERKHTNLTRRGPAALGLALLATLAAGCGGGGGGGGGGSTVNPFALGAITASHLLADVDPPSAATTVRTGPGPAGFQAPRTMALDSARDLLYLVDGSVLLRVPASGGPQGLTAEPVPVGRIDGPAPTCLTWDPVGQHLWGVSTRRGLFQSGELLRIDPDTAESVVVGNCAPTDHLAYDVPSGMLYGTFGAKFQRIDPQNGASVELFQDVTYVASASGLTSDPATGLFYAAWNPVGGTPGVVSISLSGQLQVVADVARPLADLVVDTNTGRFFGLTRGAALVQLSGFAPNLTWTELGNVGCRPIALSFDPADGAYFGVQLDTDLAKSLIKLDPDGRPRTLAGLDADVGSIAFDPVLRELWGIDQSSGDLLSIDPVTGATQPVGSLSFGNGTQLAIDPGTGELFGYDPGAGVTLRIEPHVPSWSIAGNAIGVSSVGGLDFDPGQARLVAASTSAPGASNATDYSSWGPYTSGQATDFLRTRFTAWSLGRDAHRGDLFALTGTAPGLDSTVGNGSELFQLETGPGEQPHSFRSLWNARYRAATRVPGLGEGFATDGDSVYAFDLATGETRRVGNTPFSSGTTGVVWDPATDLLGFVSGTTIRWSRTTTPWLTQDLTTLSTELDVLAYDDTRGLFYGVRLALGGGTVYSVAVNSSGAIQLAVGSAPAGVLVEDVVCKDGALYASGDDQHLYRMDVDAGTWTDLGRTSFRMVGLY